MSLKTFALGISLVFATMNTVHAETVQRILPSCVSRELLDEILEYRSTKDRNGWNQLLFSSPVKCVLLDVGDDVSLIKKEYAIAIFRWNGIKWYAPIEIFERK